MNRRLSRRLRATVFTGVVVEHLDGNIAAEKWPTTHGELLDWRLAATAAGGGSRATMLGVSRGRPKSGKRE